MKECRSVRQLFAAHLEGGLGTGERERLAGHLARCGRCRNAFAAASLAAEAGRSLAAAADAAEAAVDWQVLPERILRRIETREKEKSPRLPAPVWKPALAAATLLAALAVTWLTLPTGRPPAADRPLPARQAESARRLETSLSREQLVSYLNDSQMVLADMLKQCREGPPVPEELARRSARVQTLLQRRKYLQADLSSIELAKAGPLCRKLDFLFLEMTQVTPERACSDIERLQGLIRRDNLLLKIRLLEQDLTYSG